LAKEKRYWKKWQDCREPLPITMSRDLGRLGQSKRLYRTCRPSKNAIDHIAPLKRKKKKKKNEFANPRIQAEDGNVKVTYRLTTCDQKVKFVDQENARAGMNAFE
jgi:hypothetical protein